MSNGEEISELSRCAADRAATAVVGHPKAPVVPQPVRVVLVATSPDPASEGWSANGRPADR